MTDHKPETKSNAIRRFVAEHPGCTRAEIDKAVKASLGTVGVMVRHGFLVASGAREFRTYTIGRTPRTYGTFTRNRQTRADGRPGARTTDVLSLLRAERADIASKIAAVDALHARAKALDMAIAALAGAA